MLDFVQFVKRANSGLNKTFFKIFLSGIVLSAVVLIDQFLKYKIRSSSGFFVCNMGISFGFEIKNILFLLILSLFIILICYFMAIKKNNLLFLCGMTFLLGGAFSNIVDRVRLGCVIDYIGPLFGFFPIFNLADIAIFLGVLIISLHLAAPRLYNSE